MKTQPRPGRKNEALNYDLLPNQARRLREEAGLSLRVLSRRIGCKSWNALDQFEKEGTGIGNVKRAVLAMTLKTDVATLETPGSEYAAEAAKKFTSEVQSILDNVR